MIIARPTERNTSRPNQGELEATSSTSSGKVFSASDAARFTINDIASALVFMIYRWFTWNTCKSASGSIAITLVRGRRGNARTSSVAESRSMKIHSPDYLLFSVLHRHTRSKAKLPATLHRWGRRMISFTFDDEDVINDAEVSYKCKFQPAASMTRYPWQNHWFSQISTIQPFPSFDLLRKSVFNKRPKFQS